MNVHTLASVATFNHSIPVSPMPIVDDYLQRPNSGPPYDDAASGWVVPFGSISGLRLYLSYSVAKLLWALRKQHQGHDDGDGDENGVGRVKPQPRDGPKRHNPSAGRVIVWRAAVGTL